MVLLYKYLTGIGLAPLSLHSLLTASGRRPYNTRGRHFQADHIKRITYNTLRYGDLIVFGGERLQTDFSIERVYASPPRHIQNERNLVHDVLNRQVMPLLRRANSASHPDLWLYDGDDWPPQGVLGRPDVSFIEWDGSASNHRKMRFPLEIKLSSNWKSDWRWTTDRVESVEYRQVLSQIHFYMHLYDTRYGGILTDQELIIVMRGARYGDLMVSQSISYADYGNFSTTEGRQTVALALWCMATKEDWSFEGQLPIFAQTDPDSETEQ